LKELELICETKIKNRDRDIFSFGIKVKNDFGFKNLVVTRADKGISLINQINKHKSFSTNTKEVYDVSGAGDTVVAVLAKSLGYGLGIEHAIGIANKAAGFVISKRGTYAISKIELDFL
jgi:bifunctional ADP-heptose synthase (sugar kinase/adenylyltransferase)